MSKLYKLARLASLILLVCYCSIDIVSNVGNPLKVRVFSCLIGPSCSGCYVLVCPIQISCGL